VHAHGEVVHDADPHAGSPCGALGALELLVHDPLQPAVEVHALGEFGAQPGHERRGAVLGLLGPFLTRVVLGEGAPECEVLEPLTLVGAEPVERAPAGPAARRREDHLEGGLLGLPDGVAVDRAGVTVGGPDLFRGPLDQGALLGGQVGDLADVLGPDVDGVEEPPSGGQIGRRRQRRHDLRGVQRVDEQEVGAQVTRERGEFAQVGQVAEAPRAVRPDRVELGHEAPAATGRQVLVRSRQRLRGDRERRVHRAGLEFRDDLVPADRQVRGKEEGRPAHEGAVDRPRRDPDVELGEVPAPTALERYPRGHGGAVRHVDRKVGLVAGADHRARREHVAPGRVLEVRERGTDRLRGGGVDAEGSEDRDHGLPGHDPVVPLEVPEVEGHSVGSGQAAQFLARLVRATVLIAHERRPRWLVSRVVCATLRGRRPPGRR